MDSTQTVDIVTAIFPPLLDVPILPNPQWLFVALSCYKQKLNGAQVYTICAGMLWLTVMNISWLRFFVYSVLESAAKKEQNTAILESKKSYNICMCVHKRTWYCLLVNMTFLAILIGHLKLSFEDIRDAVVAMDDSLFSQQHLRQMETCAPDMSEV